RDFPDQHVHQVVGLACRRVALQYGRMAGSRSFELGVARSIDGDVDEGMDPQAQTLGVELRSVTANQSLPFELPHALPARTLGEPYLLAELRKGDTGVVFEQPHDLVVDFVHRGSASMFCRVEPCQAAVLPVAAPIVHWTRPGGRLQSRDMAADHRA